MRNSELATKSFEEDPLKRVSSKLLLKVGKAFITGFYSLSAECSISPV